MRTIADGADEREQGSGGPRALSRVLREPESCCELAGMLRAGDFVAGPHREVFQAMERLTARNVDPDLASVGVELLEMGHPALAGQSTPLFLASLLEDLEPSAARLAYFACTVRDHSRRRRALEALRVARAHLGSRASEIDLTLDELQHELHEIQHRDQVSSPQEVGTDLDQLLRTLDAPPPEPGLRTGLEGLDDLLGSLRAGELLLLAARPSVGKTALALNIARHAATTSRVLFVSLEVPRMRLAENLVAAESGVSATKIRERRVSRDDRHRIERAAADLRRVPLMIFDPPGLTPLELRSRVRREKARGDLGLVVVDYLGLLTMSKAETRQAQVAETSAALKHLARDMEVPVLALSQLNREAAKEGSRPSLAHLRDSGALEQDADVVMLLHREGLGAKSATLDLAKHRLGPTGTVGLDFDPGCVRFSDPRAELSLC